MKRKLILLLAFICLTGQTAFPQSEKPSIGSFSGANAEFSTSFILSYDFKLSAGYDLVRSSYAAVSFQPGAELIWALDQTSHYDLNSLINIHLLPNSDISLEPFIGPALSYVPDEINEFRFDLKYGTVLYFNSSDSFRILIKLMWLTSREKEGMSIIMGLGFRSRLF